MIVLFVRWQHHFIYNMYDAVTGRNAGHNAGSAHINIVSFHLHRHILVIGLPQFPEFLQEVSGIISGGHVLRKYVGQSRFVFRLQQILKSSFGKRIKCFVGWCKYHQRAGIHQGIFQFRGLYRSDKRTMVF